MIGVETSLSRPCKPYIKLTQIKNNAKNRQTKFFFIVSFRNVFLFSILLFLNKKLVVRSPLKLILLMCLSSRFRIARSVFFDPCYRNRQYFLFRLCKYEITWVHPLMEINFIMV